jgi:hypothetical protein
MPSKNTAPNSPPIIATSPSWKKTADREITFTFDSPGNRELPQIVGQLLILPQALVGGHRQERQ